MTYRGNGKLVMDLVNKSNLTFKVARITCHFTNQNGSDVGKRDYTVYSVFRGKTHRVIKDYFAADLLNNAAYVRCQLTDLVLSKNGKVIDDLKDNVMVYPYDFPSEEKEVLELREKVSKVPSY